MSLPDHIVDGFDTSKLPKWAQELIQDKLRKLQALKRKLACLRGEDACGVVYSHFHDGDYQNAPSQDFRYLLGERPHERVDVRLDGDHVYVNGGDSLVVVPEASNSCRILRAEDALVSDRHISDPLELQVAEALDHAGMD